MTPKEKEDYICNLFDNTSPFTEESVNKLIETEALEGNFPLPNVLLKPFLACVGVLREYNVDTNKFVQYMLKELNMVDSYILLIELPLILPIDSGYNFHESIKEILHEQNQELFKRLSNSTDISLMINEELIEYNIGENLLHNLQGDALLGYNKAKNPFVEETIREVYSKFCVTETEKFSLFFMKGIPKYFIDIDLLQNAAEDYNYFIKGYTYAMREVFLKRVAAQINEGISIKEIQRLEMFSDLPTTPPAPEAIETFSAGISRIIWKGTPGEFGTIMDELQAKGFIEVPLAKKAKVEYLQKRFVVSSNRGTETKDLLKYFGEEAKKSYLPSEFKIPLSDNSE